MSMTDARSPWLQAGAWLKSLRCAQEITASELAEQIGAPSGRWIEEVEAGRRPAPSAYYKAYARQFRLQASDFAARCLGYYDPVAYEALFGAAEPPAARRAA